MHSDADQLQDYGFLRRVNRSCGLHSDADQLQAEPHWAEWDRCCGLHSDADQLQDCVCHKERKEVVACTQTRISYKSKCTSPSSWALWLALRRGSVTSCNALLTGVSGLWLALRRGSVTISCTVDHRSGQLWLALRRGSVTI